MDPLGDFTVGVLGLGDRQHVGRQVEPHGAHRLSLGIVAMHAQGRDAHRAAQIENVVDLGGAVLIQHD